MATRPNCPVRSRKTPARLTRINKSPALQPANLGERVKHLAGTLKFVSAPGEGTTIHVRPPFAETP